MFLKNLRIILTWIEMLPLTAPNNVNPNKYVELWISLLISKNVLLLFYNGVEIDLGTT